MKVEVIASSSNGNFYILRGEKEILLLEAGINIKEIKKALDYDFSHVSACLVSHEHKDHSKSVKDLTKLGVDCYMSEGTKQAVEIDSIHVVRDKQEIDTKEFRILFFNTQHDANEPLGFFIFEKLSGKKLLFATDTYYLRYRFKSVNLYMLECNYDVVILDENIENGSVPAALRNRIVQSHFELGNVKKFFQANDCSKLERVVLIHLSDGNSDGAKSVSEVYEIVGVRVDVARPGLEIKI